MFSKTSTPLPYYSPECLSESSEWIAFPLSIQSKAASYSKALNDAKQIVDELEQTLSKVETNHFKIAQNIDELFPDLKINVEFHTQDNECVAHIFYFSVFNFTDEDMAFWEKMEAVTSTLDVISEFCDNYKSSKQFKLKIGEKFIGK